MKGKLVDETLTLKMDGLVSVTVPVKEDGRRWSAVVDALDLLSHWDGWAVAVSWPEHWGEIGKWCADSGKVEVYRPDDPLAERFCGAFVVWTAAQREALEEGALNG